MQSRRQFLKTSFVASLGYPLSMQPAKAEVVETASKYEQFSEEYSVHSSKPLVNGEFLNQLNAYPEITAANKIDDGLTSTILEIDAGQKMMSLAEEAYNLPYEDRLKKLQQTESLYKSSGSSVSEAMEKNLHGIYNNLNELQREQFKQDISDFLGDSATAMGIAGMAPTPAAPYLEMGAAAAEMASVLTDPNSDKLYNHVITKEFSQKIVVWQKRAFREKSKTDPNFKQALEIVGNKNGYDMSFLNQHPSFDNLSPELRPAFQFLADTLKAGRDLSPEQEKRLVSLMHKAAGKSFDKAFGDFIKKMEEKQKVQDEKQRAQDEKQKAHDEKQQNEWMQAIVDERETKEIEAGAQIASFVAAKVFKDPVVADGITKVYGSYSLISSTLKAWDKRLLDNSRSIGPLLLTGNFIKAFSMLASIGISQKDATQVALENIQKTLNIVRKEMHQRFDQVIESQIKILDKLLEIKNSVELLHLKMDELKAMNILNDNEDRKRDAEESRKPFLKTMESIDIAKRLVGTPDMPRDAGVNNLVNIIAHAKLTSLETAFTRNDGNQSTKVRREWDSRYIRTMFATGGINLNYMCGYLPTIHSKIFPNAQALPEFRNVDVFTEALNAFSSLYVTFPNLRKPVLNAKTKELQQLGQEIEGQYKTVFSAEFVNALKDRVLKSFADYIKVPLNEALDKVYTTPRKEGALNRPEAVIYPFNNPTLENIEKTGNVPEPQYHGRRIAPWMSSQEKVEAGVSYSPGKAKKMMQTLPSLQLSERLSMSRVPFYMAINYGLVSAINVHPRELVADDTFYRETNHMKFVDGEMKGHQLNFVRFYEPVNQPGLKDCAIDVKLNKLSLGGKSFGGLKIENDLEVSDYLTFEKYIYKLIGEQHTKLRGEFVGHLNNSLTNDTDIKAEFEALAYSMAYIAGLSQQMTGVHPEECMRFVKKSYDHLLSNASAIKEAVAEILKHDEKNPKPAVDKNIAEYLIEKLVERLKANLDVFTAQYIQERSDAVDLISFGSAMYKLGELDKIQEKEQATAPAR